MNAKFVYPHCVIIKTNKNNWNKKNIINRNQKKERKKKWPWSCTINLVHERLSLDACALRLINLHERMSQILKKMHTHMYQLITLHKKLCSAEVTWRSAESTALPFGRACPALWYTAWQCFQLEGRLHREMMWGDGEGMERGGGGGGGGEDSGGEKKYLICKMYQWNVRN